MLKVSAYLTGALVAARLLAGVFSSTLEAIGPAVEANPLAASVAVAGAAVAALAAYKLRVLKQRELQAFLGRC